MPSFVPLGIVGDCQVVYKEIVEKGNQQTLIDTISFVTKIGDSEPRHLNALGFQ